MPKALPPDIARASRRTQHFYQRMIDEGTSPRMAEILALRSFPGMKTDESFLQGRLHDSGLGNETPDTRDKLLQAAKDAGVQTHGKVYVSGLAREKHACDPNAWVSDLSEARTKAKSLGRVITN